MGMLDDGYEYEFSMCRAYARRETLPTHDLLEAVKISLNYEADLYVGGVLLASWMGLPMETNLEKLKKYGVEHYIVNHQYCFRYIDSSKNIKKFYYDLILLQDGTGELQVHDTPTSRRNESFASIEDVYNHVKEVSPKTKILNVVDFSGDEYEGSFKFDLENMKRLDSVKN